MKENKMGVMPVNKLLISMSIPVVISMLVQALYNVVDSMFVAQVSETALTAVSLAFPFQNMMIAVGVGTGVGVNSLLSRYLGEGKPEKANQVADNGLFLAALSYVAFAILGFALSRLFFEIQTDVPDLISQGHTYLFICSVFSMGLFGACMYEKLLTSTGKTVLTMCTQGAGAIINLILDPILIFGLFGMPALGIAGAAIATVTGQIGAMLLGWYLNKYHNDQITIRFRSFKPDTYMIKKIYGVGVPSIIMQCIGSIMTFGMNSILITFSTTATAVFGIYFKLQSFVFMPIFGLNNGLVPIVAYNYGAEKPDRIIRAVKLAVVYATGIMVIGLMLFQVFPQFFLSTFNASEHMMAIGVPALRIISLCFVFAGFGIITSSTFQALGHGMYSLSVSLCRQLVVLLPIAWLLGQTGNLDLVWVAFPIAECASLMVSLFFLKRIFKKEIRPLQLKVMNAA